MDDSEAIAALKRGEVGGLEALVRRYQLRALRAAYLIVRDQALAEDLVQTAFLRAYEVQNSVGVNTGGRSLGAALVDEGVRIWKGEPFERAMTNFYLGIVYYTRHDYNNCRAAMENALSPRLLDRLFEDTAQQQFTRDLLFSSVVGLMTVAATAQARPAGSPA